MNNIYYPYMRSYALYFLEHSVYCFPVFYRRRTGHVENLLWQKTAIFVVWAQVYWA